jgi:hypothetical protein
MLSAQLYLSERKCCTKKRLPKHSFVVEGQDGKGEETVSKHSCAWICNTMTKRYSSSGRKRKNIDFLLYYYYYYSLLEFSFHSVAVFLALVQKKQIRINKQTKQYKKKNSTNNAKHRKYKYTYYQNTHTIVKTPTYYKTHTYTHPHFTKPTHTHNHTLEKKFKQPHTNWNNHNTIKYPQYKITLMYMLPLSPRTAP